MAKTLQIGLAAVLSAGVALAFPAYAASKVTKAKDTAISAPVDLNHTSTKAAGLKGKKLATVDANERRITAELNKKAMSGQTGQQSSLDSNSSQQQASAETDSETTTQ
jgi:hypothetical protein